MKHASLIALALVLCSGCETQPEPAPSVPTVPSTSPETRGPGAHGPPPPGPGAHGPPPAGPGAHGPPPPGPGGEGGIAHRPGRAGEFNPLEGIPDSYYEGLRALERYLTDGDRAELVAAEEALVEATRTAFTAEGSNPEAALSPQGGPDPTARPVPYRLVRYVTYLAYARELLGDTDYRDRAVEKGLLHRAAYDFHFRSRDPAEVIAFELLDDSAIQMRRLEGALRRWADEHDGRYPDDLVELVPSMLDAVPSSPRLGTSYGELYGVIEGGAGFRICSQEHQELNEKALCVGSQAEAFVNPNLEQEFKIYPMLLGPFLDTGRRDVFLPLLLERAPLERGMVVADIGTGAGMFTLPFAEAVGPEGKVYAVDINASVLAFVDSVASARDDIIVETVRSTRPDVSLPEGSLDMAFIIQTYHAMLDLDDPNSPQIWESKTGPWMRTVHEAMKPGGTLVIQDGADKMDPLVVVANLASIGFVNTRLDEGWDRQYIAVFRRSDAPAP
jgi:SAM-dependent methyltransferase